jgi:hypothetical protein
MFGKLKKLWNDRGFELIVALCVGLFLIFGVWNWLNKKKGTWTKDKRWYPTSSIRPNYTTTSKVGANDTNVNNTSTKAPRQDSKGELECRRVLRELYGKPFKKCRPNFLKNKALDNNQNLELDCFDKITLANGTEVLLGVEYHGRQHYEYIPYFHGSNKQAFETQKYRDYIKKQMCRENRVELVEVPYKVKLENIKNYLVKELDKRGLL